MQRDPATYRCWARVVARYGTAPAACAIKQGRHLVGITAETGQNWPSPVTE